MEIPWLALLGGALLGASASLLLLFSGQVAGISGIASRLLRRTQADKAWRIIFLAAMVLGGAVAANTLNLAIPTEYDAPYWLLAIAGLLVGLGTAIGNGCTSGHGICGMGRGSVRSIVATGTFMLVAALTVFIIRHLL
ncbi:YeeE/YedE family protein [Motilimonas pumila]|uniref:YeeE/YedE family protein n=1 Tax=Motilimonas pumila TaxID=2303987 RepID=A0A418YBJ0_9GAMM|nr:YeeE/YedE family protein [Motilimonas pumila]RJG41851.1 YeeE/YedE family protein [Motilimonas pumila]